jgi:poly(3-hydroxybutyrate) depolymerase
MGHGRRPTQTGVVNAMHPALRLRPLSTTLCACLALAAACTDTAETSAPGTRAGGGGVAASGPASPTPAGAGAFAPAPLAGTDAPAAGSAEPTSEPAAGEPPAEPTTPAEPQPDDASASAAALAELDAYLATDRATRPPLDAQPFADTPLTADDAAAARALLWEDLASHVRATRAAEHAAKSITIGDFTLRYETVVLGSEPASGRDLFISMHGGGSGPASTNDSQWQNQIALATSYAPEHALWVAPRAPTDDWNMWFKDHIDGLFDRLITNMIVFEGIDPDRVYLNGYSAGGDGVYGLSPRTADRWAGAGMSAGHPNGVSLANLRNVAFALHVGGDDTAFDRNLVAQEYIDRHLAMQAADPEGYPFQGMVHPGLPHWMNLEDAVSIPFMQSYTRSATPSRVVWEQHEVTHRRLYWLAIDADDERAGTRVVASYAGQLVTIEEAEGLSALRIRLDDAMLDMDAPVHVERDGATLFEGVVPRTARVLAQTLDEREDPSLVYAGELEVQLP